MAPDREDPPPEPNDPDKERAGTRGTDHPQQSLVVCGERTEPTHSTCRSDAQLSPELVDDAGRPIGATHLFRRTGASLEAALGVPDIVIKKQLGHSRFRVTAEHYIKLPDVAMLQQYAEVFER